MHSNEERKLLEIAKLLNEHKGEKGVSAFISKNLKVSGKDVGKVKRMMNDGFIVFNNNEPKLIVQADKFEPFIIGKAFVEWAAKRGIRPQEITNALIDEVFTKASEYLEHKFRKAGRPKGSSLKPQLLILRALTDGPKSFQRLVDATGLHRNTIANNLKILASMKMFAKNRNHGKIIYRIDLFRLLFFFEFLALKGNMKAKKAIQTAQKEMKPFRKLLRHIIKYLPEIVELLSRQPELINRDFYDILYFAIELYSIKREKYNIERKKEKPYQPSHPQKQIHKIREDCLSLRRDFTTTMSQLLKTFLKNIMKTEDIKNLILSGQARHLKIS